MSIGENIKNLRNIKGMTQAELAKSKGLEISIRTLQKYESGEIKPPLDKINKLASALSVSVSDLMLSDNEKKFKKDFKDYAYQWNKLSDEEREVISQIVKGKFEVQFETKVINTILSLAEEADCIDFVLNDDNTPNYDKCLMIFNNFKQQLQFFSNINSNDKK